MKIILATIRINGSLFKAPFPDMEHAGTWLAFVVTAYSRTSYGGNRIEHLDLQEIELL